MRIYFSLFAVFFTLSSIFAQNGLLPDEIYVKINTNKILSDTLNPLSTGIPKIDELNKKYKAIKMYRIIPSNPEFDNKHRQSGLNLWYSIYFEGRSNTAIIATAYSKISEISVAEPVHEIARIGYKGFAVKGISSTPGGIQDPLLKNEWNYGMDSSNAKMVNINLTPAWNASRGSSDIIIALLDDGVDPNHPDLIGNIWRDPSDNIFGHNFDQNSDGTFDSSYLATPVAGILVAKGNNGEGLAGVAGGNGNNGCKLMACGIKGKDPNVAAAFVYAADNGAVLSQADWSYKKPGVYNKVVRDAIQYFIEHAGEDGYGNPRRATLLKGGLVFAPAGDFNTSLKYFPQAFEEVITVAALNPAGKKARYTNYGSHISLSAPGGDAGTSNMITTTFPGGKYDNYIGTDIACAHVVGTAALILAQYGNAAYLPDMLRCRLISTAQSLQKYDNTFHKDLGAGLLNAGEALTASFPSVNGVVLDKAKISLEVGQFEKLVANVSPDKACNRQLVWNSSKPAIAVVNSLGMVQALQEGTTDISVVTSEGNFRAVCGVEVKPSKIKPVTALSITPYERNINLKEEFQIEALIKPEDADNKNISWTSSNPDQVAVSNKGKVTGLICGGAATITAITEDGNYSAHAVISVGKIASGVSISKSEVSLVINEVAKLDAGFIPSDACKSGLKWESSDPTIVSVDPTGKIKGLKCGSATVIVMSEIGLAAICSVEVGKSVSGVQLASKSPNLIIGQEFRLSATVLPDNACNKEVEWVSTAPDIVSVDNTGKIVALKCGQANIEVRTKENKFSALCTVSVGRPVNGIVLSGGDLLINRTEIIQLKAKVLPDDACNKEIVWQSSNRNFVTVDSNGKVEGVNCGKSTITATTKDGNFSGSCVITVGTSVKGISMSPTLLEVPVGEKRTLTVSITPADACNREFSWNSSDPTVANVDNKGVLTTLNCGNTVISATTHDGGFTAQCKVKVGDNVSGISLSPSSLDMQIGDERKLDAQVSPLSSCNKRVTWTSSNPNVVSVDNAGKIKALSCGSSTITVQSAEGNFTARSTITIGKAVTGVTLSKGSLELSIGQTIKLSAVISPKEACNTKLLWISNNPSIVTVNQNGEVKALKVGKTKVSVTTAEGSFMSACEIEVK